MDCVKRTVLVEDELLLQKSLTFFLTSRGYDVTPFDNGEDASAYIRTHYSQINVVITDLNLPFTGGRAIIDLCRHELEVKLPVVVLTSSSIHQTELEILEMGAQDFIAKPFNPEVLLKRIERCMLP
jgi:two-component system, OmpR family, response regulator Irr